MFRVGTGLDSQLYDFEIISQIRTSFSQSKSLGLASNFMERLVNAVIQASKKKKTDTEISSGATGLFCFCSIYIKNVEDIGNKNILLLQNRTEYL
jgi:glutamyl-tRNA reductase